MFPSLRGTFLASPYIRKLETTKYLFFKLWVAETIPYITMKLAELLN